MPDKIRLTKKLLNDSSLWIFDKFISNGHWITSKSLLSNEHQLAKYTDDHSKWLPDKKLSEMLKKYPNPFDIKLKHFMDAKNDHDFPVSIFASEDGLYIAAFNQVYVEMLKIEEIYMKKIGLAATVQNPIMGNHQINKKPWIGLMTVMPSNNALRTYKVLSGKRKAEWLPYRKPEPAKEVKVKNKRKVNSSKDLPY